MRPINRINLILALCLLALLAIGHWPFRPSQQAPLLPISAAQVNTIEVVQHGQVTLRLQRDGQGWQMLQPQQAPANQKRVELLLGLLLLPKPDAPLQLAPAQAGLKPPQLQLRYNHITLDFGSASAAGDDRYIGYNGKVYLVKNMAYRIASLPASQFLRPR